MTARATLGYRGYGVLNGMRLHLRDTLLLARAKRNSEGPRILCNSFPKSGTHLLYTFLRESTDFVPWNDIVSEQSLSGLYNSRQHVHAKLLNSPPNSLVRSHLPADPSLGDWLASKDFRSVLILRDPRDVMVSHAHWVLKEDDIFYHYLYSRVGANTVNEIMRAFLLGVPAGTVPGLNLSVPPLDQHLSRWLPWLDDERTFVVRFEDLIGLTKPDPPGESLRLRENLLEHLSVPLSPVSTVTRDSHTFRSGKAGAWRDEFDALTAELAESRLGGIRRQMGYE